MRLNLETINNYLYSEQDKRKLSLMRVGFGFIFSSFYLVHLINYEILWGGGSYISSYLPTTHIYNILSFSSFLGLPISFFLILTFISALMFMLGINSRVFGIVLFILNTLLSSVDHITFWGFLGPARFFLMYLILSNCHNCHTLQKKEKTANQINGVWHRIIGLHVILVYYIPLSIRLTRASWLEGQEVYRVLLYPLFSNFNFSDEAILANSTLVHLLTYVTILLELSSIFFIFKYKFKNFHVTLLILLHVMILISTTLIWWQMTMIFSLMVFYEYPIFSRRNSFCQPTTSVKIES
jgi:hypothetical protein